MSNWLKFSSRLPNTNKDTFTHLRVDISNLLHTQIKNIVLQKCSISLKDNSPLSVTELCYGQVEKCCKITWAPAISHDKYLRDCVCLSETYIPGPCVTYLM